MGRSIFKYIFVIVIIILICYTGYKILKDNSLKENENLDQTSKVSTIQKNLRLAIAEMDTMNPILSKNRNVQEISKIIFEPLVTLNQNYKLENCLAKEVVKQDDFSYIIKLRENVLWQNGNKFTASDVKFTIDTIKSQRNFKHIFRKYKICKWS